MKDYKVLVEHFSAVEDPRIERSKKHLLIDILTIGIIGTICGAKGWEEIQIIAEAKYEWLKKFLTLPNGIPSHDTISRVFAHINVAVFEQCFTNWMQEIVSLTNGEVIAIDGKCVRRSHDKTKSKSAIHMVSAWAVENGVVIGQNKVDEKSNEIVAIPKLLETLEIAGCIVTIDAMGAQTKIAQKIIDNNADYVLGLKGNQGSSLKSVKEHFDTTTEIKKETFNTVDNDHGRLETRECVVKNADILYSLDKWPGLKSVVMVRSTREIRDKKSIECRYYLSSLSPDNPEKIAKAIRSHWSVENSLHWVLDVTFDEDRSRIRKDNAAETASILRRISLNLVKMDKSFRGSVKRKMLKCCLSNKYLEKVFCQAN